MPDWPLFWIVDFSHTRSWSLARVGKNKNTTSCQQKVKVTTRTTMTIMENQPKKRRNSITDLWRGVIAFAYVTCIYSRAVLAISDATQHKSPHHDSRRERSRSNLGFIASINNVYRRPCWQHYEIRATGLVTNNAKDNAVSMADEKAFFISDAQFVRK
jgi:hypothetical protein